MSEETPGEGKLVWMDLEMTGLDVETDAIIEIATLVTDDQLNEVAAGPTLAIQTREQQLAGMDDWNRKHHGESGLLARVRESEVTLIEAEARTLAFLEQHVAAGASPLCGNSIWQDRRFLAPPHADPGTLPPLPHHRRKHRQGTSPPLAPERIQHPKQAKHPPGPRRHPRSIAELAHYRRTFLQPTK